MTVTSSSHPLIQGYAMAIGRCQGIVRQLTPEQFQAQLNGHDSIGAHLRHCLDHQTALVRGCQSGLVDYDARERAGELQSNPDLFLTTLEAGWNELRAYAEADPNRPLRLRLLAAPDTSQVEVGSTLGRELNFLTTHAIHHLAVVKLLAEAQQIQLEQQIDLAYSTAAWQKSGSPQCAH